MEAIIAALIISSLVAWTYVLVLEKRNERQHRDIRRLVAENNQLKFMLTRTQEAVLGSKPPPPPLPSDEDSFVRGRQVGRLDVVIWLCRSYRGHSAESLALSASNAVRDMNEGRLEP